MSLTAHKLARDTGNKLSNMLRKKYGDSRFDFHLFSELCLGMRSKGLGEAIDYEGVAHERNLDKVALHEK